MPMSPRVACNNDYTNEESKHDDEFASEDSSDTAYSNCDYDPTKRIYSLEQLQVFSLLNQPIWIYDYIEGRMRWANKAGCHIWNSKSLEELLARCFKDTSEVSAKRMEGYLAQFERGFYIRDQWTIYPNGKATTIHASASGIKLAEDADQHFCLLCEGVPVADEELLQASLRGVEMIRHLPMAVCQFDLEGKLMFQNPAAMVSTTNSMSNKRGNSTRHLTSESKDDDGDMDRSGHSIASLMDSMRSDSTFGSTTYTTRDDLSQRFVDPEVGWQVLREIQSPNKTELDIEAMVCTQNGARWNAIQLRKAKDPVTGETVVLYSARDKSDAVKARKEREARERKSEFLAIMAHEIRTPLHQVTGFIDLLDETPLNIEQKSYVRLLKSSAQGLMTVISDVLDYSKLEAGKMKLECIPYEPLSVVEGSMAAVRASCEEKDLYLKLEWDKDIPFKLKGDPNRLRQILLNLLSNAIKFTKDGGISVKVKAINTETVSGLILPMIRFEIRDTGVGISDEHKDVIFLKYQQANAAIARNFGGTGLGLSICKLLTRSMRGYIGVESKVGEGAMFWVNLPAIVAEEVVPTEEEPVESDPFLNGRGLHILVAEDNKVNRKLLANMLKRMGHTSDMAVNGKEAISMVMQQKYDVVLMDIQMPVMDGLEATRRLRTMGYSDLPIYGLTASVARNDYKELGFDDWIGKPVPMKDLKSKLYRLKVQHNENALLSP